MRPSIHRALALGLALALAPLPAHAEKLKYDIRLFGVDVGEVEAHVNGERITLKAESAGALYLFLRAKEEVEIHAPGGKTKHVVRRFDHGGEKKGEWRLDFGPRVVKMTAKTGEKSKTRRFKIPRPVLDPASALQLLRKKAPAKKLSALLFGFDGLYRLVARRVARKPLRYVGTFERTKSFVRKRKRPKLPTWLRTLGLGKGATEEPELEVTLTDDARRIPTRLRLSDPRGSIELVLTEPTIEARP